MKTAALASLFLSLVTLSAAHARSFEPANEPVFELPSDDAGRVPRADRRNAAAPDGSTIDSIGGSEPAAIVIQGAAILQQPVSGADKAPQLEFPEYAP